MSFVMMIGISGAGKSSYIKEKLPDHEVFSSDQIREEFFGDASIQKDNNRVFNTLHARLRTAVLEGKDVVYDATNLSSRRRAAFLRNLPEPVEKRCVLVLAMPEICITRDRKRDRSVGRSVIMRQLAQFQPPHFGEGWDQIVLNFTHDLVGAQIRVENIIKELHEIDHDNPHHIGTIGDHLQNVQQNLSGVDLPDLGLLHDIGKYYTKTFDEKGIAHYYGHEYASAYLSYFYNTQNPDSRILARAYVISLHMRHYSMSDDKYRAFLKGLPGTVYYNLLGLRKADHD